MATKSKSKPKARSYGGDPSARTVGGSARKRKASSKSGATRKPAARKRSASKKSPSRKSQPKGIVQVVGSHPFAPGTKVGVHTAQSVEIQSRQGDPPAADPLRFATVAKDGTLKVTFPEKGIFAVCGQVEESIGGRKQTSYKYVTVGVS